MAGLAETIARGLFGETWRKAENERLENERARQVMELATKGDVREDRRLGLAEGADSRAAALHDVQLPHMTKQFEGAMTDREKAAAATSRHNEEIGLRREIAAAQAARDTATAARLEAQLEETRKRNRLAEREQTARDEDRTERRDLTAEDKRFRQAKTQYDAALAKLKIMREQGGVDEEQVAQMAEQLYNEFVARATGQEVPEYTPPPEKEGALASFWRQLTSPNVADPFGAPRPGDDLRR
jgi:hypothetical protein